MEFPEYYTIDERGLNSLCYFLSKEFDNQTVLIEITPEKDVTQEQKNRWKNKYEGGSK